MFGTVRNPYFRPPESVDDLFWGDVLPNCHLDILLVSTGPDPKIGPGLLSGEQTNAEATTGTPRESAEEESVLIELHVLATEDDRAKLVEDLGPRMIAGG